MEEDTATSNFDPPNFRTLIFRSPFCCRVCARLLVSLYSPPHFTIGAYRSLLQWKTREPQKATPYPLSLTLGILVCSIFRQGILSSYRKAYWKFLRRILTCWYGNPPKLSMGFTILLSGHHFIKYAREVAAALEAQSQKLAAEQPTVTFGPSFGPEANEGAPLRVR